MPTLELSDAEFQALAGLIDAGVRATGLRGVKEAAVLLSKMEAANTPQVQADVTEPKPGEQPTTRRKVRKA